MKNTYIHITLILLLAAQPAQAASRMAQLCGLAGTVYALFTKKNLSVDAEQKAPSLKQWADACDNYPLIQNEKVYDSPLAQAELIAIVRQFTKDEQNRLLNKLWIKPNAFDQFNDTMPEIGKDDFQPFVQKCAVDNNTQIALHGDLHGDVHSLNGFLRHLTKQKKLGGADGFTILDSNFKMVFLGDYTDRGIYGAECIYTILRLKQANPDNVILVRGNHEDVDQNEYGGFFTELKKKFNYGRNEQRDINKMYNVLPVALFLGSKETGEYMLCCHGGLEPGHDELKALFDQSRETDEAYMPIDRLLNFRCFAANRDNIQRIQESIDSCHEKQYTKLSEPFSCGYLWNDFMVRPEQNGYDVLYQKGRGWRFGKKATESILDKVANGRIKGVIRAHQHGDREMMNAILNKDGKHPAGDTGIAKIWRPDNCQEDGKVWPNMVATLAAAPHNGFGRHYGYNYDAFAMLNINGNYDNWKLQAVRIDPIEGDEI